MKTLKIGTKSQADKLVVESLFKPVNGKTLSVGRFDMGKYKPGSYVGREITTCPDDVYAIYAASGRDSDGHYVKLMCVSAR